MTELIANRDLKYPQPGFKAGERFTATAGSARMLTRLRWASPVEESVEDEKPKRKYRRRDLTSE